VQTISDLLARRECYQGVFHRVGCTVGTAQHWRFVYVDSEIAHGDTAVQPFMAAALSYEGDEALVGMFGQRRPVLREHLLELSRHESFLCQGLRNAAAGCGSG